MQREFNEAKRFAGHVAGRGFEAARSALSEMPAAIVAITITIGLPLGMVALAGQAIR